MIGAEALSGLPISWCMISQETIVNHINIKQHITTNSSIPRDFILLLTHFLLNRWQKKLLNVRLIFTVHTKLHMKRILSFFSKSGNIGSPFWVFNFMILWGSIGSPSFTTSMSSISMKLTAPIPSTLSISASSDFICYLIISRRSFSWKYFMPSGPNQ